MTRALALLLCGLAIAFTLALTSVGSQPAHAQALTVLHGFGSSNDGFGPMAGVTMDHGGNIYGTAYYAGTDHRGMVWRLSPRNGSWTYTPLYSFQGNTDGNGPAAKVTVGPDGALYGTTTFGGGTGCQGEGCGIVFRLTPPPRFCHNILCTWHETVLHRFDDDPAQGVLPWSAVIFDAAGNLYGTAFGGGHGTCPNGGCGVVYKMTQSGGSWSYSVIYNFGDGDGAAPMAALTPDGAGNFYGTTAYGGPFRFGNVYRLVNSGSGWTYTSLYSFQNGTDGGIPNSPVVLDEAGNIYGSNTNGGGNLGVVWELSPNGGGWNFTAIDSPYTAIDAGVTRDSAGNLYVLTYVGPGGRGVGALYELSPSGGTWTETVLHAFAGNDGYFPYSDAVLDANGSLYGTTTQGGQYGGGTVWELTR